MSTPPASRISVELSPAVMKRLNETRLADNTLGEEAVRMLRYAFKQMFPPQTPDDWRKQVTKDDWLEMLRAFKWIFRSRKNVQQQIPLEQPYQLILEVSSDTAAKLESWRR